MYFDVWKKNKLEMVILQLIEKWKRMKSCRKRETLYRAVKKEKKNEKEIEKSKSMKLEGVEIKLNEEGR